MSKFREFLKRKDIEISAKRYFIDAMSAMAQGLFCSLLIGTIINTLGTQLNIGFLTQPVATVGGTQYTVGGLASAMSGPAMAVAIGFALHCPPMVLFSLATVGFASNALGGAGGPLAVFFVAIIAAELGKAAEELRTLTYHVHLFGEEGEYAFRVPGSWEFVLGAYGDISFYEDAGLTKPTENKIPADGQDHEIWVSDAKG